MLTIERDAVEKGGRNSASWIDDGDKYAVIALAVKLDDPVPLQQMTPHHWVFADKRFDMPPHWRGWLGTIRTQEVEGGVMRTCRPRSRSAALDPKPPPRDLLLDHIIGLCKQCLSIS